MNLIKEIVRVKVFILRQVAKFEDQTPRPRQNVRGRGSKKLPRGVSRQGNCLEDYITASDRAERLDPSVY